jgi:hypothetical protein
MVDNLIPDFLSYWNDARGKRPEHQRELWHSRYARCSPDVFASYARHYSEEALNDALHRYPADASDFANRADRLAGAIESITPRLLELFALPAPVWDWVLMVGVYSSDGWADLLDSRMTCLLAVEMIENGGETLITHEMAHAAHGSVNPILFERFWTVAETLFGEGLAVATTTILDPSLDLSSALWPGRKVLPNDSPIADWISQCEASAHTLQERLLRDQASMDQAVLSGYFEDSGATFLPARSGYFAGQRIVAELLRGHPLSELAQWSQDRIHAEVSRCLKTPYLFLD